MNTTFRNILVVDDSANDYETYVRFLQKAGPRKYKTKCFSLGKEVFGPIADRPDCLLLDLSLPDMNGLDIISKLKARNNESLPFPVVMLTGSGDETTGEKAVRLGVQDYLIKEEITVESLSRSIEFAISRFALEQQLRASEERARHLATNMKMAADASGIGFWSWDARTGIVIPDENNRRALGLPLTGTITYADFLSTVFEEDRASLVPKIENCFQTGLGYDEEFRVRHADGSVHWIAARGSVITDGEGRACGMTGMALDITARKQMEQVLRDNGQRMRIAHQAARSGIWEWDLKSKKAIWTPEVEALYGLPPGSFSGRMDDWRAMTNTVDLKKTELLVKQALEKRATDYQAEFRITRADGAERWIEAFAKIVYDADGTPLSMVGVNIDITERKTIAQALEQSEWRSRQLIESNVIPVVFADDKNITEANDAFLKMVGYTRKDLAEGRIDWMKLTTPEYREKSASSLAELESQGFFAPFEKEYFRKDGSRVPILIGGTRLKSDPIESVCFILDLSDLRRTQAELEAARKDLEVRVKNRTQELSNALEKLETEAAVRADREATLRELSARMLRLQDEERRRIARDLHDTTGQTLTALKLTAADLQESVESSSGELAPKFDELLALADQALKEIRTTSYLLHPPLLDEAGFCSAARWYIEGFAKRSGIEVKLDFHDQGQRPAITVETVLFRVLQESLTNIIRHAKSSVVDVTFHQTPEQVVLSIRDYGKGITPERLEAFELTGSGMGVGLAGMRERVRELGGDFKIDSSPEGTCLTATLNTLGKEKNSRVISAA